ncbi:hypothetical protein ONZ51_g7479 [Trametes cubensis]|uniref:Uncharacterized protein n=1 Tax=Trametes cubensis TaxID=1111947 RepID=A0AAD7TQ37_9APHY|nr:hypothetical protein ONZ51_g7479 [Trametes cubensis]
MVGSKEWPELERWSREMAVSEVWGHSTSGMDITPRPDADMTSYCWLMPAQDGWENMRRHLQAFIHILVRWPGCPVQLCNSTSSTALTCSDGEYSYLMELAVVFYVHTFVAKYQRLPIPPVCGTVPWRPVGDIVSPELEMQWNGTIRCSCEVPVFGLNLPVSSLNLLEDLHLPDDTPRSRSLVSCDTMGKSTWRMQEILLLEMLDKSDQARQLYESASKPDSGWWSKTVNYYTTAYLKEFKDVCFPRETDSELAARQARTPSAQLSRFEEETAQAKQARLSIIRQRIGSYVRNRSPNKKASKNSKQGPPAPAHPSPAPLDMPTTDKMSYTSGFQEFKKSDHAAKPPMQFKDGRADMAAYNAACKAAFDALEDRSQFEALADQVNEERSETARRLALCRTREDKAQVFPSWISDVCTRIGDEIGWIGWFPVGGVDEDGHIKAIFVGSLGGRTFEQWLAEKIRWSVRRLRNEFDNYLQEVFDPPSRNVTPGVSALDHDDQPAHSPRPASAANSSSFAPATRPQDAPTERPSSPEVCRDPTERPASLSPASSPSISTIARENVNLSIASSQAAVQVEVGGPCLGQMASDSVSQPNDQDSYSATASQHEHGQNNAQRSSTEYFDEPQLPILRQDDLPGSPAVSEGTLITPSGDVAERSPVELDVDPGSVSDEIPPALPSEGRHGPARSGTPPRQLPKRKRTRTARAQNKSP